MRFRETFTYSFHPKTGLEIYEKGHHVVHQPHDSETGRPFEDVAQAIAWAEEHFPEYFTP
jgi:hypothetical protein